MASAKLADTYNGWTNYETWNVHLWLTGNDQPTSTAARNLVHSYETRAEQVANLTHFCLSKWGEETPDGAVIAKANFAEIVRSLLVD